MAFDAITINRAPVLTLWAAIVAERLGFTHDEALTLGRAVAGLNAYSKGNALGIFKPTPKDVRAKREAKGKSKELLQVELLHRAVPVAQTPEGLRALSKEQPIAAASVEKYRGTQVAGHKSGGSPMLQSACARIGAEDRGAGIEQPA